MVDSPDPSKPQLVPSLPADVKSVSTATPIVPRSDSFAGKVAQQDIAQGNVKQAAISEAAEKAADMTAKVIAGGQPAIAFGSQAVPLAQLEPSAPLTRTDKLRIALEKFISVKDLTDSSQHFSHLGVCTKCGWQSYQHSEDDARTLVRQHAQQHWRDVTAEVNAA